MGSDGVARYARWLRRRHRVVLALAALATVVSVLGVSRLRLRASFKELLPSGNEAGRALDEARRRVGEFSTLVLVIESPDPAKNRAYAAGLTERIGRLPPTIVERALYQLPALAAFFHDHRWLYADESFLRDVCDRLRFELQTRKNPLYVALDEPPTLNELKARARRQGSHIGRLPRDGLLATDGGRLIALVVLPGSDYGLPATADRQAVDEDAVEDAVREVVAAYPPSRVSPAIRLRWTGSIHTDIVERHAIEKDVAITSAAVVLLVSLVVGLYFGRLGAVPMVALPAIIGSLAALGFAGFVIGTLNATTAFLGGILLGNGINYPILVLSRYDEERRRGHSLDEALPVALAGTARPTALVAFAASLAYGSLALTRFRGFNQFGLIGCVGMVLCWLCAMTLLPALLCAFDRRPAAPRTRRLDYGRPLGWATEHLPVALLVLGTLATVGSVVALPRWLASPFDYDFRHLRSVRGDDPALSARLDGIFGRALGPSLVLTDSPAEDEAARRSILAAAARHPPDPVEHVVTLDGLLPGTAAEQRTKLALLEEIRGLLGEHNLALLSAAQRKEALSWRPPPGLRVLTRADLPILARRPFTERDGTVGRVLLVYPPEHGFSSWNGHDLERLAAVIRRVPLPDGHVLHGAGSAVVFAAMLEAIAHDGPIATVFSLTGVALLTFVLLRRLVGALAILGTLCVGVLWMLGVVAVCGLRLNFLNFIALPITFGIGVDYAVNVWLRYRPNRRASRRGHRDLHDGEGAPETMPEAVRSTGGAVLLNSLTTVIGYAALLVASNRALRSFGAVAILGEAACVAAALLVMPSLFVLRDRRRSPRCAVTLPDQLS